MNANPIDNNVKPKGNTEFFGTLLDDRQLGEQLLKYLRGTLSIKDKARIESQLKKNLRFQTIYQLLKTADGFSHTEAGRAWLKEIQNLKD